MNKNTVNKKITIIKNIIILALFYSHFSSAALYFNAKVYGPVTNIYSIDENKKLEKITENTRWKDIEHDVSVEKNVVFSSNREDNPKVDLQKTFDVYDLYFFDNKNDQVRKLTNTREREYSPKFDRTGKKIAYLKIFKSNVTELRIVDSDGDNDRLLKREKNIFDFSWSPDGKKIAYSVGTDKKIAIDMIDVNANSLSTLIESDIVEGKSVFLTSPTWSSDGKKLAYVTHPSYRDGVKSLFVMDIATKKAKQLSEKDMQVQAPVLWSKDNKRILYSALLDYKFYYDETLRDKVYKGSMQVFISDISGKTKQLTQGEHFHGKPTFSPDESKVAYLFSEKLGGAHRFSLWISELSTGNSLELHDSVQRESKLVWR